MKALEILDKLMRAENWDDYYLQHPGVMMQ